MSVQGHYNLLFREEEREMLPYCHEEGIALTPYSPLAGGRLSRLPDGTPTRRLAEDEYAKLKYDSTEAQDRLIVERVAKVAEARGASMTEVALAWLMRRTTAPVVGMTKPSHVEDAVRAVELRLTDDEVAYLEAPYVPHRLVGVMAQTAPTTASDSHV
ncbi:aldo/keto reductase [Eggerthella sp. YY7918]|uniref:aldo/keto reductase n=1 Tax=Eggerthella sp. (strain YY7918) TaxID=502558 RepID=UPI0002E10246|nr:aldo/keto reductase [Eggerthella sp. YY7918]